MPFNMKIGLAGEAFFVFETDEDVSEELITSPITSPRITPSNSTHGTMGEASAVSTCS
jgi:phosphatidate phosphatase PAH1